MNNQKFQPPMFSGVVDQIVFNMQYERMLQQGAMAAGQPSLFMAPHLDQIPSAMGYLGMSHPSLQMPFGPQLTVHHHIFPSSSRLNPYASRTAMDLSGERGRRIAYAAQMKKAQLRIPQQNAWAHAQVQTQPAFYSSAPGSSSQFRMADPLASIAGIMLDVPVQLSSPRRLSVPGLGGTELLDQGLIAGPSIVPPPQRMEASTSTLTHTTCATLTQPDPIHIYRAASLGTIVEGLEKKRLSDSQRPIISVIKEEPVDDDCVVLHQSYTRQEPARGRSTPCPAQASFWAPNTPAGPLSTSPDCSSLHLGQEDAPTKETELSDYSSAPSLQPQQQAGPSPSLPSSCPPNHQGHKIEDLLALSLKGVQCLAPTSIGESSPQATDEGHHEEEENVPGPSAPRSRTPSHESEEEEEESMSGPSVPIRDRPRLVHSTGIQLLLDAGIATKDLKRYCKWCCWHQRMTLTIVHGLSCPLKRCSNRCCYAFKGKREVPNMMKQLENHERIELEKMRRAERLEERQRTEEQMLERERPAPIQLVERVVERSEERVPPVRLRLHPLPSYPTEDNLPSYPEVVLTVEPEEGSAPADWPVNKKRCRMCAKHNTCNHANHRGCPFKNERHFMDCSHCRMISSTRYKINNYALSWRQRKRNGLEDF